jgi:hypothetical protein
MAKQDLGIKPGILDLVRGQPHGCLLYRLGDGHVSNMECGVASAD